ncbi:MAG TPA: hypothetical protein VMV92_22955 [Streptosporangiaceae bacterium]|nr:hypothetical protein [Streptosporangiaceae bacterium]
MRTWTTSPPAPATAGHGMTLLSPDGLRGAGSLPAVAGQPGHAGIWLPATPGNRKESPGARQPDLAGYLQILIAEFAAHGRADDGRCRCGRRHPCPREQQAARLLDQAGDACR